MNNEDIVSLMERYKRELLEFEKPIAELEQKIDELNGLSATSGSFEAEIAGLRKKARSSFFANPASWDTLLSRTSTTLLVPDCSSIPKNFCAFFFVNPMV